MNLGDPRFSGAKHRSHFFHGEIVEVIECQHLLFLFRQLGNHPRQEFFHLRALTTEIGRILRRTRKVVAQVFFLATPRRLDAQAAHLQTVQFSQQVLQLLQGHAQFGGYLVLRGDPAQFQTELAVGFLDLARLAPQLSRTPIHLPQAVEDGAADAKLGVRAELHMFGAVELVERVHQSDYARVHQVFERHVPGQPLVDAARQVADLGQLFEQDAVSLFLFLPGGIGSRCILAHGIITSRQNSKFVGVRQHTQNGVAHLSHRSQFFSVFRFRVQF